MSDPNLSGQLAPDPVVGGTVADPPLAGALVTVEPVEVDLPGGQGIAGPPGEAGADGVPGPQGQQGPPGPATVDLPFVAVRSLSGHRAVYALPDGSLDYASTDLPASFDAFLGVTTGAAAAGAAVTVRVSGDMVEPSWAWAVGPVWLGLDGNLTQTDPGEAEALLIGVALAPTRLLVLPEPAFRLG